MIIEDKKLIFIHIMKTGGTSVTSALTKAGFSPRSNYKPSKHETAETLVSKMGYETFQTYRKMTVVRNPYDRAVSWWKWSSQPRIMNKVIGKGKVPEYVKEIWPKSFAGFIKSLEDIAGYRRLQFETVQYNGRLEVDYLFYFEEFKNLNQKIGDLVGAELKLPHLLRSNREHYKKYYNSETQELVANFYRKDFVEFGYSFDL